MLCISFTFRIHLYEDLHLVDFSGASVCFIAMNPRKYDIISDNLRERIIQKRFENIIPYREIARILSVKKSSVKAICLKYAKTGLFKRFGTGRGHRPQKLTNEQQTALLNHVRNDNSVSLKVSVSEFCKRHMYCHEKFYYYYYKYGLRDGGHHLFYNTVLGKSIMQICSI